MERSAQSDNFADLKRKGMVMIHDIVYLKLEALENKLHDCSTIVNGPPGCMMKKLAISYSFS